jgi:4-amino-4-deoxy-L-arabinose transferase-like glycosyltransferase
LSSAFLSQPASLPARSTGAVGARLLAVVPLILALAIFLALCAYQLDLPGLHYDEAKEAGLNAMQLVTGQPVTAFRDATTGIGRWRIPLMVQDYIGNLNVLLAVPFLAIGGINTTALRALPIAIAALTLILAWSIARRLGGALAAAVTALLLAVNPSFVFWSRQGVFVTNITALLFMAALWTGILWWQTRRPGYPIAAAFFCGLGIYAKLLFVWAVVALAAVAAVAYLVERRQGNGRPLGLRPKHLAFGAAAFVAPLLPLIFFNLQTGGTLTSIFGHLGQSYYGVDNSAYGSNLLARIGQVGTLLRGDHFWYLGEVHANPSAPWLMLGLVLFAFVAWLLGGRGRWFTPLLPIALLLLVVLQSAFTVSDLFITHFALIAPLPALVAGLSVGEVTRFSRVRWANRAAAAALPLVAVLIAFGWGVSDAQLTLSYHRILTISGGYAGHSDAIYRLADYLDKQGYAGPIALDWGVDAPVRFLTAGRVQPVDVFGYDRLDAPDPGFAGRVAPYLEDWQTIYVGHAPEKAVFKGRLEAMAGWASERGWRWLEQIRIAQRSGEPVFIVYRFLK